MSNLPFDPALETYVSLATFRKTGKAVPTAVWIASHESVLYVFSESKAGKVKRLRNNTSIELAACDVRGNVRGDWIEGEAYIVTDQAEVDAMYPAFTRKYGWQMRIGNLMSRVSGRYHKRTIIAIKATSLKCIESGEIEGS